MKRINSIIRKSVTRRLSPDEERELAHWITSSEENEDYYAKIKAIYTLEGLKDQIKEDDSQSCRLSRRPQRKSVKHYFIKYSAAALVLIASGVGGYFVMNSGKVEKSVVVEAPKIESGVVIKQNNKLVGLVPAKGGSSAYKVDESKKEIVLNEMDSMSNEEITIFVDRGFQYQVILPDSTKVWLNSESELRYVSFGVDRREVSLKGEACFDVVKDKSRPFIVKLNNNRSVTVLGTFFSVKAYDGDNNTKVSLVEGSVNIKNGNESMLLTPNREIIIDNKSNKSYVQDFDSRQVKAMITGGIVYYNEELENIAKDISRRYNREFTFEDNDAKKERLTVVLDTIIFDDIISYIKKAGKGVFNIEQRDGKVIIK